MGGATGPTVQVVHVVNAIFDLPCIRLNVVELAHDLRSWREVIQYDDLRRRTEALIQLIRSVVQKRSIRLVLFSPTWRSISLLW